MKIEYSITTAEQKRQILAGSENRSIDQWVELPDRLLTMAILDHPRTNINYRTGDVLLHWTHPMPVMDSRDDQYWQGEGAAYGNVAKKQYFLRWDTPWDKDRAHAFDYLITEATFHTAFAEIEARRSELQADADARTAQSAATLEARAAAYNDEHGTDPAPEPAPEPDPFAAWRHLPDVALYLRYGRPWEAAREILDVMEANLADTLRARGLSLWSPGDLASRHLADYDGDVPIEALRALDAAHGVGDTPRIYYEDDDPVLALHRTLRVARYDRTVAIYIYAWGHTDDAS